MLNFYLFNCNHCIIVHLQGVDLINYFRMLDTKILSSKKTIVVNRK